MRKWIGFLILGMGFSAFSAYAQQDTDLTKYQDTVFIRYNKDANYDRLNYVVDTVIFQSSMRRHVLTGTCVLPATRNQMAAREYGLYFKKVVKSNCQKEIEFEGFDPDRINSILVTDTTLMIDINITDNCCFDFLCDCSVDSTGTLNLTYTGYGTYCSCDCCFGLTYYLLIYKEKDTPELKGVMINGNRKTLKAINKW